MRQFAALFFCLMSVLCGAQTCTRTDLGMGAFHHARINSSALRPDGGAFSVIIPDDVLGDMVIVRSDVNDSVIWSKRLATTDPTMTIYPGEVIATSIGGAAVLGGLWHPTYENAFALEVDSNGTVVWAKILGRDSNEVTRWTWPASIDETAEGKIMLTYSAINSVMAVILDSTGATSWTQRYQLTAIPQDYLPTNYVESWETITRSNGDRFFSGRAGSDAWAMLTDAAGTVQWTYRYATGSVQSTHACETQDGGYLLGGAYSFMPYTLKIDANGTFQWMRTYDPAGNDLSTAIDGLVELPNGDLFATLQGTNVVATLLQADGTPLNAWAPPANTDLIGIAGSAGDSVVAFFNTDSAGYSMPNLVRTSDATNWNCALQPSSITSTITGPPTNVTDTVFLFPGSIKSWDLSLGQATVPDKVDMRTFVASTRARSGSQFYYAGLSVNSGGNTSGPVTATFTFDPQLMFVSATPIPTTVTGNVITWNGPAMEPASSSPMIVDLQVPAGIPIGTSITGTYTLGQDSAEVSLTNNTASFTQLIVGSYDPNTKEVRTSSGQSNTNYIIGTDEYLDYTIQFQNTGTADALTIVVVDSLPLDLDSRTFQLGPTSHPCTYEMGGDGIARFIFNNINLPDSTTNEPASHGLINFRIKPNKPEIPGTVVTNVADIFFDFNAPIRTPEATVVLGDLSTHIAQPALKEKLLVYPVPAKDMISVSMPQDFDGRTFSIVAHDGRVVMSKPMRATKGQFDVPVNMLPPSGYLIDVRDANGRTIAARFTKE